MGGGIEGIFKNPSTTDDEKAAQLAALMGGDIVNYATSTAGALNLNAKYAPNFRAYKLLWDRDQYDDTCYEWGVYLVLKTCESSSCYDVVWDWYVGYGGYYYTFEYGITSIEEFYYEPDYKVYRVVDGEDKLITTIKGYQQSTNWLDFGDIWDELNGNGVEVPENGLVIYDFDSDLLREKNTSLSYKIVASTENHKPWCVSAVNTSTSTLVVDADKDGDPDFVPWHVLHEDVLAALVVINTLLM